MMKKLTSILLSVCMLMTICSFTGCGEEKWAYYEGNGTYSIVVSNCDCKYLISDNKLKNIEKQIETKMKDIKLIVTEESIKGFLKDDISFETTEVYGDYNYYVAESIRAEEFDNIFEIPGHTVETYVDVDASTDKGYVEFQIFAEYDNDEDINCYVRLSFMSPAELERREKVKKEKIGEYKYNDIEISSYVNDYEAFEEKDIIIKALEEKFKDVPLKVTENEIQILESAYPVELSGDPNDVSKEFFMTELENILTKDKSVEYDVFCWVYDDGTAKIKIHAMHNYNSVTLYDDSVTAELYFVKQ